MAKKKDPSEDINGYNPVGTPGTMTVVSGNSTDWVPQTVVTDLSPQGDDPFVSTTIMSGLGDLISDAAQQEESHAGKHSKKQRSSSEGGSD